MLKIMYLLKLSQHTEQISAHVWSLNVILNLKMN